MCVRLALGLWSLPKLGLVFLSGLIFGRNGLLWRRGGASETPFRNMGTRTLALFPGLGAFLVSEKTC